MRTVGEILKKARTEKKLTLEDVERILRIRKKFLLALEENDWDSLPSLPYIKGFLKNYSTYLGLMPQEMMAIFRRQFGEKEKAGLLPKGLAHPLDEPSFHITPQFMVTGIIISFLVVFFGYLLLQYKIYTSPPSLSVDKPPEGAIVHSDRVDVSGKTDSDAVVAVNNQKIAINSNGEFTTTLTLNPGINTITVESISKYGKKRAVERTIQIQVNQ